MVSTGDIRRSMRSTITYYRKGDNCFCVRRIQDDYDSDDGVLRPQYRRLSLHSAAVSSRGLLSAMSVGAARILHVPTTGSPPPVSSTPAPWSVGGFQAEHQPTEIDVGPGMSRRHHSFHRSGTRPPSGGRARLSLDYGTARKGIH